MFERALSQMRVVRAIHAAIGEGALVLVDRCTVLLAVIALGSPAVWAQEPTTSFDRINLVLEKGDKVTLVDLAGDEITGRITRLAPDGLDLKAGGKIQTFPEKDIRRITREKPDSPLNGFLIGAGIGFGATLQSKFCPHAFRRIPRSMPGSNARHARSRSSTTRTSVRSSTSAIKTVSTTW